MCRVLYLFLLTADSLAFHHTTHTNHKITKTKKTILNTENCYMERDCFGIGLNRSRFGFPFGHSIPRAVHNKNSSRSHTRMEATAGGERWAILLIAGATVAGRASRAITDAWLNAWNARCYVALLLEKTAVGGRTRRRPAPSPPNSARLFPPSFPIRPKLEAGKARLTLTEKLRIKIKLTLNWVCFNTYVFSLNIYCLRG